MPRSFITLFSGVLFVFTSLAVSAAPFAYITNSDSNSVSVIDLATNTVPVTVSLAPGSYPLGVAVHPDGSRVYVANNGSNTVSVINTTSNTISATVTVGTNPWGVTVSPDGSRVYVANNGSNTVSVINAYNNSIISTVPVGFYPIGIAVSPDGSRVYVSNFQSNSVSVVDTYSNTVIATVSVPGPFGLALSPDGSRVYVTSDTDNTVFVINADTNIVTDTVPVGVAPRGVAVTPDGSRVYVANRSSNSVSVIDTTTNSVADAIAVGFFPYGVALTSDGSRVYVANNGSNTVSVIDTTSNTISTTVTVENGPAAFGQSIKGVGTIYTVSTTADSNGSITPASRTVFQNGTTHFTVTPNTGYHIASVSGCGGVLSGYTYTTGPVTADCTVSATFAINTYTVSATAGPNGSIALSSQVVDYNSSASFTLTPAPGYHVDTVSDTCGAGGTSNGSLSGNTYTTGPVTADCAVSATFAINTYTVSATAGPNGSIAPSSQVVDHNTSASFTLAPATGYHIGTVSDTCGASGTSNGSLSGNTYTTGSVTGDCSVSATFAIDTFTVTASAGPNGSIAPSNQVVNYNGTASFTLTPATGYHNDTVNDTCGAGGTPNGSLGGNTYITGPVTAVCSVRATFVADDLIFRSGFE